MTHHTIESLTSGFCCHLHKICRCFIKLFKFFLSAKQMSFVNKYISPKPWTAIKWFFTLSIQFFNYFLEHGKYYMSKHQSSWKNHSLYSNCLLSIHIFILLYFITTTRVGLGFAVAMQIVMLFYNNCNHLLNILWIFKTKHIAADNQVLWQAALL